MKHVAYRLFETPLGWCGIAWSECQNTSTPHAVTLLQLPEATTKLTESRIAQISGAPQSDAPPPQIAEVIRRVCKHLQGELQDFRDIPVDMEGVGPFAREIYEAAREIPAGETISYVGLAKALGRPTSARAIGQALGRNPIPLIIPCHRVLAADGKVGGFSSHGGRVTKARLLAIEGVAVNLSLDFSRSS
jgi:O-6-methylguanine DNA methyltransferase